MPLFRRNASKKTEPAPRPAPAPAPARQPHLLVCDDNDSVTQLVSLMFANESWSVEVVTSGRDCLAALERRAPDVVLLDQQLGDGLTGLETAKLARKAGFERPILLFSAHLDEKSRKRATQLDVLPVSKLDFPAVVRHVNAAHRAYTRRRTSPEARREAESPAT
jgi:two-component system, OmpR family, response regulator